MPEKAIGSPAEAAGCAAADVTAPTDVASALTEPLLPSKAPGNAPSSAAKQDDGITNPRDGRGPLRHRDDQAAKLPLRPPH